MAAPFVQATTAALPRSFTGLAASNLAAQSAEQPSLAAVPLVTVLALGAGGRETRVKLNVVMLSNNGAALMAAMREGVGLCVCPSFMTRGDMDAGRIEPVLLEWSLPEYRVFAVYPHRRFVSAKVRIFLEALAAAFGNGSQDPWWPLQFRDATAGRQA